jgi:hypothetical protein
MTSPRRSLLLASVAAAALVPAAPALALPDGCADDADCLIEHVFGGAGAPAASAAATPEALSVAVLGPQPALGSADRRSRVTLRVRVSARSVLEARTADGAVRRRSVGAGVHSVRVRLERPGRHRIALSAVDGAGRRATAVADVVVLASPSRLVRG